MKYLFHFIIFILFFQIEVRVRASNSRVFETPEGCWKQSSQCAIRVNTHAIFYAKEDLKLTLTQGSILIRENDKNWRFVDGQLWVEDAQNVTIQSIYADFKSERGQFWVLKEGETIHIRNITADLHVLLKDGHKLDLPQGFEVWLSGVDQKGNSKIGMVEPIDIEKHLALWNEYYRGTNQEFKVEVFELKKTWGNLVEKSSQLYGQVAQRHLANEAEKNRRIQYLKDQQENEKRKQKELYFEKAFNR